MPYEAHPLLATPPDQTVISRYFAFLDFVQLLEKPALWFAKTATFEDPLEGTYTDAELRHFDIFLEAAAMPGQTRPSNHFPHSTEMMRNTTFVNCWRAGTGESMAMWDIYGKGPGTVAVRSTVALLKAAVAAYPRSVFISAVKYID